MQSNIRNFSIIAHIDHGKTTLTDRFLQMTNTISKRAFHDRVMDSNPIEQERGITIKLAPVRMEYKFSDQWPVTSDQNLAGSEQLLVTRDQELTVSDQLPVTTLKPEAPASRRAGRNQKNNKEYILNLIDTPGHVDFGYEVSRSLAACEGVILLIDATQGIQAQTLANYEKAVEQKLKIIPVLNKIDLPSADTDAIKLECMDAFGVEEDEILLVSAKSGLNASQVLDKVIEEVPAPRGNEDSPLRALIFTSQFDSHKGVIAYVRVVDGELKKENLKLLFTDIAFEPTEVGFFTPTMTPVESLKTGEVGYVCTGLKDISTIKVGDTITTVKDAKDVKPLPGYREPLPMVYMQFFPIDGKDFVLLQDAVSKLTLHDSALVYSSVHSPALGNGLRMGFLGLLHAEIIQERLRREFNLDLIATTPTVTYKIEQTNGEVEEIYSPAEMPDPSLIKTIYEPMTKASIYTPEEYVGVVMKLCRDHRGELLQVENKGVRAKMSYNLPLSEIIVSFHDKLKSATSGFASLEYEVADFRPVDAVKLDILVHGDRIDALSQIVVKDQADMIGRAVVKKLKEVLPRQMFEVAIQAAIGGKVLARETLSAYRKDVTAKLYGGDVTRRQKLLRKQSKGKKKMKQMGKVELNQESFLAVLER